MIALGVAFFAGVSIYTDLGKVGAELGRFRWWAFGAALALATLNYALRFVRWSAYLRSAQIDLSYGRSALVFLSGFALSITPGKLGELFKCYLIREYKQVPIARSAPLVVGERLTDLLALLLLGMAGVAAYGQARTMVLVGSALMTLGLIVLVWPSLAELLIRTVTGPVFLRRFREPLLVFYAGLAQLVRPWPLAWATAIAMLAWLAECVGFALIVNAFPGAEISLGLAVLIYAVTTIAGALSFLPGGLLVTETTMVLLLVESASGIHESTAVAAIFLTRLATLWFAVFIGIIAMSSLRRSSAQASRALAMASAPKRGAESDGDAEDNS